MITQNLGFPLKNCVGLKFESAFAIRVRNSWSILLKNVLPKCFFPNVRSFTEELQAQLKNYTIVRPSTASSKISLQTKILRMLLYSWRSTEETTATQDFTNACSALDIFWTRSPCSGTLENASFQRSDGRTKSTLTQKTQKGAFSAHAAVEHFKTNKSLETISCDNMPNIKQNSSNGDTRSSCFASSSHCRANDA